MSLSKQNYVAIAKIIARRLIAARREGDTALSRGVALVANDLADYFAHNSVTFDHQRFLAACNAEKE